MGKVSENKHNKLHAMLDSAYELFTEQGIHKTSVSDIASHSGVAKGTFYLYFKDKYDIRNRLVIYESQKVFHAAYLDMQAQPQPPETLQSQIIFIVNHILDQLVRRKDLLRLISKNLSWGVLKREIVRAESEDKFAFATVFLGMTAPYGISAKESEILLYLLVELVGAACYHTILDAEPCSLAVLKPYLFDAISGIVQQFCDRAAQAGAEVPNPAT